MEKEIERFVYGTVRSDRYEYEPDLYEVENDFTEDDDKAWKDWCWTCNHSEEDDVFYYVCLRQTVVVDEDGEVIDIITEELDEILDSWGVPTDPPEWHD